MLRDLAGWVLYSPRRLLATGLLLVALAASAVTAMDQLDSTSTTAKPAAKTLDPDGPARASSAPDEEGTETRTSARAIRRVATKFLDEYVVPRNAKAPSTVPPTLERLSTPALWRGLRLTRPGSLPTGRVEHKAVEGTGPFSGSVTAKLTSGATLEMTVVAWQNGWRVSDVRPSEAP